MVNNEKMSKSKGNFLMVTDVIDNYSVDCSRLALADAGDSLEDANFIDNIADTFIFNLIVEEDNIKEWQSQSISFRSPEDPMLFMDKIFDNDINDAVHCAKKAFDAMLFKEALKYGWYVIRSARDTYREWSKLSGVPMRIDLIEKFFNCMLIMITPFAPHFTEYIWSMLAPGKKSITYGPWPVVPETDFLLFKSASFLRDFIKRTRATLAKRKVNENKANIFITDSYSTEKSKVLSFMQDQYDSNNGLPDDLLKSLKGFVVSDPLLKPQMKQIMQFASFIKTEVNESGRDALNLGLPFDQMQILKDNQDYIKLCLELDEISFFNTSDTGIPGSSKKHEASQPGKPSVELY